MIRTFALASLATTTVLVATAWALTANGWLFELIGRAGRMNVKGRLR